MPSTITQKIRKFLWLVSEKMSKNSYFWHVIPLNPQIKIFFKNRAVSVFLLSFSHFMQNFRKNLMNGLQAISRRTDGWKDGRTGAYSKSGTYVQKWVLGCFKDQRVPPSVSRKNVIRVPQGTRLIEGGGTPFFGAGLVVWMVYRSMGGGVAPPVQEKLHISWFRRSFEKIF